MKAAAVSVASKPPDNLLARESQSGRKLNRNRKENAAKRPFSCKIDYFNAAIKPATTKAYEFFTGNYGRVSALGNKLAAGLNALFGKHGLDWTAIELGPRSGYCLAPSLPGTFEEAAVSLDDDFIDARRVFMANRGIWDAVASAGPQASFAHSAEDIDAYLSAADAFLDAVVDG